MPSRLRTIVGFALVLLLSPFILVWTRMTRRDPREFGLTPQDRAFEIARKMGPASVARVDAALARVEDPDDRVLGAIVFLSHSAEGVEAMVALANEDRPRLLNAAQVKEERG